MLSSSPSRCPVCVGDSDAECGLSGYLTLPDGRHVAVRDGLLLGRVAECDVVIDDHKASRRHAKIVVEAGVVEIEDLGSSNGTLLNGKPVSRRLLREGDEVQIGKSVLKYHEGGLPSARGTEPAGRAAAPAAKPPAVLHDDDDLFGGEAPAAPTAITAITAPPPPPPPPPARPVPPPPPPPPPRPAPVAAVPPPPPAPAVVEFADEIVELRKPAAATPATTPAAPAPANTMAEPVVKQRVLQFSKQAAGGMLRDDLSQWSGGARAVVYALVLAAAAGLAWLCLHLVR